VLGRILARGRRAGKRALARRTAAAAAQAEARGAGEWLGLARELAAAAWRRTARALGRQLERCGSGSAQLTASGAGPRRWADAAPERSEDGSWRRAGERLALVACGARRGSALAQATGDAGGVGARWASGHWAQGAGAGAAGAEQSGLCR
jgi:hypothetical protein